MLRARRRVLRLHRLHGYLSAIAVLAIVFEPADAAVDERKLTVLVEARNAARRTRNFAESDRIRDELAAMGVVLKDSKDGTTWEIAR